MKRDLTALKAIIKADYLRHVKRFSTLKPDKDIVFIGDSIVAYFPLKLYAKQYMIHNLGIPGDTTKGVLERIHQVMDLQPKHVILHIGLNDEVLLEKTPGETIESIAYLVKELKGSLPKVKLTVVSLTPINQSNFPHGEYVIDRNPSFSIYVNEGIQSIIDIQYVNLFDALLDEHGELDKRFTTDGIHLNKYGYDIYNQLIEDIL